MAIADQIPDNVRTIIGLEPLHKTSVADTDENADEASGGNNHTRENNNGSRRNSSTSGNVKFGDNEVSFERGLDMAYMWGQDWSFIMIHWQKKWLKLDLENHDEK